MTPRTVLVAGLVHVVLHEYRALSMLSAQQGWEALVLTERVFWWEEKVDRNFRWQLRREGRSRR